jgi:DNA-binding transcriptional LysR family regulator
MHEPKLSAVDLNLLVILRALLAERHVTRAAASVGLSQSATSHALARLRELYGDPLLVRSGKRLDLTPRALTLQPRLERGLAELSGTISGAEGFDPKTARQRFTVGMADYTQALLLPPLLRLVAAQAPGIELAVHHFPDVLERLDAGTLDFSVHRDDTFPPAFSKRRMPGDSFVCAVRKGHPVVRGARLSLAKYLELGHVLVSPSGLPGSIVDTELTRRGLTRRIALTVSSFLVAPLVVAQSDLITTGPARLLRAVAERYSLRLVPTPFRLARFDMALLWHSRRDHDPALAWLSGVCLQASREI